MSPPVLCYHLVGGPLALGVTRVSCRAFGRQMRALARTGWRTLTLDEFAGYSDGAESRSGSVGVQHAVPLPAARDRLFLLTFDDGYASLADYAYPLLADLGYTATTFLVTDYVGRMNTWDLRYTWRPLPHLDWRAIETWQGRGFDFGSHTASHARLTWLDDPRAEDELARSRAALVARLGRAAGRAIAYPFGATDARVERLARAAGYELGFGGVRGNARGRGAASGADGALGLPRVPVYTWDCGSVPFGLRDDRLGAMGTLVAHMANRCAVGTTVMQGVRCWVSGVGHGGPST